MQEFTDALLDTVARRNSYLLDALEGIVARNPHQGPDVLTRNDLEQVISAATVVLKEACVGESDDIRNMYMGTVVAAVVQSGTPLHGVLRTAVAWAAVLVSEIDRHIDAAHRDRARTWLADTLGDWLAEVAKIGVDSTARRKDF